MWAELVEDPKRPPEIRCWLNIDDLIAERKLCQTIPAECHSL